MAKHHFFLLLNIIREYLEWNLELKNFCVCSQLDPVIIKYIHAQGGRVECG